jgi:hypothetical protein
MAAPLVYECSLLARIENTGALYKGEEEGFYWARGMNLVPEF